jgi:hypothetical protein
MQGLLRERLCLRHHTGAVLLVLQLHTRQGHTGRPRPVQPRLPGVSRGEVRWPGLIRIYRAQRPLAIGHQRRRRRNVVNNDIIKCEYLNQTCCQSHATCQSFIHLSTFSLLPLLFFCSLCTRSSIHSNSPAVAHTSSLPNTHRPWWTRPSFRMSVLCRLLAPSLPFWFLFGQHSTMLPACLLGKKDNSPA